MHTVIVVGVSVGAVVLYCAFAYFTGKFLGDLTTEDPN